MIKLHRHPPLCAAAAAFLAAASLGAARASVVSTGDTFSIEAVGFNQANSSGDIYIIQPGLQPTFGDTETFAGDALEGQTLTETSSESTTGGITTDTISISVPNNFVPSGTTDNNGNIINAIQFSIGIDLGGTNPLDFSMAIGSYTPSGTVTFQNSPPTTAAIPEQNPMLSNNGTSYSDFEQTMSANQTIPISENDVTGFSISITNPAVPESSTWAAMLVGAGLLGLTFRRRFRVA